MRLPHIDLSNPDNFPDGAPHHWFKELREKAPVYWHEEADGPGFWCVTKYDDLRYVSRNPKIFSSEVGGTQMRGPNEERIARARAGAPEDVGGAYGPPGAGAPDGGPRGFPIMINMDPPHHVKFRRLVQRSFTPRMIADQEPHIRDLTKRIIDAVATRGECEFVEEVAAELPLQVICEMMGVPVEYRKEIFDASNRMIGFDDPELGAQERGRAQSSAAQLFGHAMKVAQELKEKPADNLSSMLLNNEIDGEKLTELEYCAFFLLLCVAGNETTRTVTTNGMNLLMKHPDQLQLLVDDPSRIPCAVEEILRYEPAVHYFRRTALVDAEIRGQKIREGDKVLIWYPSANRDEDVFDDPDRFDVTRHPNEHLSFGIGEHFCLGASLARLELNVVFEEIISRLRAPKHDGGMRRLRSNFINGVKEMRITFEKEAA